MLGVVAFKYSRATLFLGLFAGLALGCQFKKHQIQEGDLVINAPNGKSSSTSGNLMTTAIAKVNDIDIVFYPAPLIQPQALGVLREARSSSDVDALVNMFPPGPDDQFMVGTMKGRDIQKFIIGRSDETYSLELEVSGLKYHIHYHGGVRRYANFRRSDDKPFDEERTYKVAVSGKFFFSGATFPGYKYRNSFNFIFNPTMDVISARESLRTFLESHERLPYLQEVRGRVTTSSSADQGHLSIHQIQGAQHRSPVYGARVKTVGVVTAAGQSEWYPRNTEVYIQTLNSEQIGKIKWKENDLSRTKRDLKERLDVRSALARDDDDQTSEGLLLVYRPGRWDLKMGDVVEVSGVVYEEILSSGLGRTSLREISEIKILNENNSAEDPILPPPIHIGRGGREIPFEKISSYVGNLNLRPSLDLNDAIDFWESLEGMRIVVDNPRVVGFRGGKQDVNENKPKTYLNIYMLANGDQPFARPSKVQGVMIDDAREKFNPHIFQVITNHLTRGVDPNIILQVGDLIQGSLEGVLTYEKNIFGDGEYAMVLPFAQKALAAEKFADRKDPPLYSERPKTRLVASESQLSVATFNLENLPGYDDVRLARVAEAFVINLRCPDVMNLVEVQDNNGTDFADNSSASQTLAKLISYITIYAHKNLSPETRHCLDKNYTHLNVNPIQNSEGGEPGGNIRVAMLYDQNKLKFTPRGNPSPLLETVFTDNGSISPNPGRVFPNNHAFDHSRRSIVAEFEFRGRKVFVIGNHLASKLGDSSLWGETQPAVMGSEKKRIKMAFELNKFVQLIKTYNPDSRVIVLGDFNAYMNEQSMKTLEGQELRNLLNWNNLLPVDQRYTYNHNGNSQAIDFIFACFNLLGSQPQVQPINFNSDYMGRLSDHDPVIALFQF